MAITTSTLLTKIKKKDRESNWNGTNTIKQQAYNAYQEFVSTKEGMLYFDDEKIKELR